MLHIKRCNVGRWFIYFCCCFPFVFFFISSTNTDNLTQSNRNGNKFWLMKCFDLVFMKKFINFKSKPNDRNAMKCKLNGPWKRRMHKIGKRRRKIWNKVHFEMKRAHSFSFFDVWLRRHVCGYTETCIWYRCAEIETKVCNLLLSSYFFYDMSSVHRSVHIHTFIYVVKLKWNINAHQGRGESPLYVSNSTRSCCSRLFCDQSLWQRNGFCLPCMANKCGQTFVVYSVSMDSQCIKRIEWVQFWDLIDRCYFTFRIHGCESQPATKYSLWLIITS